MIKLPIFHLISFSLCRLRLISCHKFNQETISFYVTRKSIFRTFCLVDKQVVQKENIFLAQTKVVFHGKTVFVKVSELKLDKFGISF